MAYFYKKDQLPVAYETATLHKHHLALNNALKEFTSFC